MPKKKINTKKQRRKNRFGIFLFVLILLLVGLLIYRNSQNTSGKIASENAKDSLQLGVYNPFAVGSPPINPPPQNPTTRPKSSPSVKRPAAPRPEPTKNPNACNHDNGKKMQPGCSCEVLIIECRGDTCISQRTESHPTKKPCVDAVKHVCGNPILGNDGDGEYCFGKPVIYLYPEVPTLVNVAIKTTGFVFISDPQIEEGNTWTDVTAHPDGTLFYKGEKYKELFYETKSETLTPPKKGLSIKSEHLKTELLELITKMGLTQKHEQDEFLDWWLPRLEAYDSAYWFVGILDADEKKKHDTVIINPKPDTFIEFIVYFKPLQKPFQGEKFELPSKPPARDGFTAIEWGGVIDDK